MKIGFVIYPGMQLMDLVGPLEVFNVWKMLDEQIEVILIAQSLEPIASCSGITLQAENIFTTELQFDGLIVPGGFGRLTQVSNSVLTDFIRRQAQDAHFVASVCTGAFLLQAAGLLRGHQASTYWQALPELALDGELTICEERIVQSGKIWSCGGVTSGIDLALALIAHYADRDVAGRIQLMMEYFPSQEVYCAADDLSNLPAYPREVSGKALVLPKYIHKYVQK